ncbi:MAG: ectonucleotide pyrophosphatase/phosphodiesterase [Vicinamibacteraceae bacterium]
MVFASLAVVSFVAVSLAASPQSAPAGPAVLLISIDGLHPGNVLEADRYGLKIPTLRRLLREGAHATAVRGVLPTVTYPSHTTMLTGVWPVRHGIPNNVPFDPLNRNLGVWYWYAEDIKAPTLWDAARAAGYVVGSVSWPVSVGAPGIAWNIPEYWRAMKSPEEIKLVRAISTPGLFRDLEPVAGRYTNDLDDVIPGDEARTRYAVAMIGKKQVRFLTIHMAGFDHVEHEAGPYSAEAFRVLEAIDGMVAEMERAMRAADPKAIVCVVSDHGFAATTKETHINAALVEAGLVRLTPPRPSAPQTIADWDAAAWNSGGSAAIMLKNPGDAAVATKVEQLLRRLAADPASGIAAVLDAAQIAEMGGTAGPAFLVDFRPGYAAGGALTGPVVRDRKTTGGAHGYAPTHPELQASFFIAGPGIAAGKNLGEIDMRAFAPTLAQLMRVPFPTADLKPLPVLQGDPPAHRPGVGK